jgi:hypothetical protein
MIARTVPIAIAVTVAATACGQTETEIAEEHARERLEAGENLDATRQRADMPAASAIDETAAAEARIQNVINAYEQARAEAMDRYAAMEIQCDALERVDQIACLRTADAELAADEATATRHRDAALARIDRRN